MSYFRPYYNPICHSPSGLKLPEHFFEDGPFFIQQRVRFTENAKKEKSAPDGIFVVCGFKYPDVKGGRFIIFLQFNEKLTDFPHGVLSSLLESAETSQAEA